MPFIDSKGRSGSRPEWTALEGWTRKKVHEFIPALVPSGPVRRGRVAARARLGAMLTFYSLPKKRWIHSRTTNRVTVSSPRLRTDAAKRFKKLPNAAAAIWKLLMVAEKALRRLNAPELLKGVYLDAVFEGTSAFLTRMVPVHSVRLEEGS